MVQSDLLLVLGVGADPVLVDVQLPFVVCCVFYKWCCTLLARPFFRSVIFPALSLSALFTMSGFLMSPGAPVYSDVVAARRDPVTNLLVMPLPQQLTATQASFVISHSTFYTVMR